MEGGNEAEVQQKKNKLGTAAAAQHTVLQQESRRVFVRVGLSAILRGVMNGTDAKYRSTY